MWMFVELDTENRTRDPEGGVPYDHDLVLAFIAAGAGIDSGSFGSFSSVGRDHRLSGRLLDYCIGRAGISPWHRGRLVDLGQCHAGSARGRYDRPLLLAENADGQTHAPDEPKSEGCIARISQDGLFKKPHWTIGQCEE